jgi:hypothetical protein
MGEGLRVLERQDFQRCGENRKLWTKGLTNYTTSNSRKINEKKSGLKKKLSKRILKIKRANKDFTIYKSSKF